MSDFESVRLTRVLTLRDLLIYGMIILQVVGPLQTFGLLERRSNGHAVLTAIVAMIPMLTTAISYGRMAVLYPMAGSAYTYVGRAVNPHLGFLVGWSMLLDYLMILMISAIIPTLAIHRVLPSVPQALLTALIIAAMTGLNLRGIRSTLRANMALLIVAVIAVALFVILAVRFLGMTVGWDHVLTFSPIFDPATFSVRTVLSGISLAAISYIGFDGLTTLAEDCVNPKRDMVLATVFVVLIIGILGALELYLLHSVLPDWHAADPDTSYLDVMRIVGGPFLFFVFVLIISTSQFGAGFSVQVNVARLLYGMGRDNVLPRGLFGHLSSTRKQPSRNIILVGFLAFGGSLIVSFEHALDLLNFGAFLGFMGVNAATLFSYYVHPVSGHRRTLVWDALLPAGGFIGCLIFWVELPARAKVLGGLWLLAGVAYCAYKTRGFRDRPLLFAFQES